MKNKALFISVDGGDSVPARVLFSRALPGQEPSGDCLKQLDASAPIKVIHGHSSGIMDGFRKIAKGPLTPENRARADELESYFERAEGPIVLFGFGPAGVEETLLPSYPKKRLRGNPFVLIHENGTGVAYWNPKTGLVLYVPHDAELIEVIQAKPIQGMIQ
jgi:hypothetical protein